MSKLSCGGSAVLFVNNYILMSKYYSNDICITLNGITTIIDSDFLYIYYCLYETNETILLGYNYYYSYDNTIISVII